MTKRILSICITLFVFATGLLAQDDPFAEVRAKIDHVLQHINRSRIPTGILDDYGIQSIPFGDYDGVLRDSNFVNTQGFIELYDGLKSAEIDPARARLAPLEAYADRIAGFKDRDYTIVPLILHPYAVFRRDAVDKGLMQVRNEQVYDGPNEGISPYETKLLIAASPLQSHFSEKTVRLMIPEALVVKDAGTHIRDIRIRFEDGGTFRTAKLNEELSHTYDSDGLKRIVFRITLQNGRAYECQSKISVLSINSLRSTKPKISDVDIPLPPTDRHSGGTLQIVYGKGKQDRQLRKPLIIAEGYDPGDLMLGDYDISSLYGGDMQPDFFGEILSLGYDIVFLNYGDGIDDIRRNAELMKDALRYVNAHKVGGEKNVVMGLSMGGLVAAYALRDMEILGEEHGTHKYISYDSPHYGANVPYGVLCAAKHFIYNKALRSIAKMNVLKGRVSMPLTDALDNLKYVLDKPASRQLLAGNTPALDQLMQGQRERSFFRDDLSQSSEYNTFMADYHKRGLPRRCTNVAFSNGTMSASLLYPNNSTLIDVSGEVWSIFGITSGIVSAIMGEWQNLLTILIPGPGSLRATFAVKALPSSQRPYVGEICYRKRLLWIIPIDMYVTRMGVEEYRNGPLSHDAAPGGILDIDQIPITDESNKFCYLVAWGKYSAKLENKKFTFVSRNSAFAIPDSKMPLACEANADTILKKRLSPFDRIYGVRTGQSENHIQFESHKGVLLSELKAPLVPPDYIPRIEGPNCLREEGGDFRIANPIKGLNYDWEAAPNIFLTSHEDVAGRVIRGKGYWKGYLNNPFKNYGNSYVKVKAYSDTILCGTAIKYLWIGRPSVDVVELKQDSMYFEAGNKVMLPSVLLNLKAHGDIKDVKWKVSYRTIKEPIFIPSVNRVGEYQATGVIDTTLIVQDEVSFCAASRLNPRTGRYDPINPSPAPGLDSPVLVIDGIGIVEDPPLWTDPCDPDESPTYDPIPETSTIYRFIPVLLPSEVSSFTCIELSAKLINDCGESEWTKPITYRLAPRVAYTLQLYPTVIRDVNPRITIDGQLSTDAIKVEVWNNMRMVKKFATRADASLPLLDLSPGIYIVRIIKGTDVFEFRVARQ